MNSIMVDNWFMEEVLADIHDKTIHASKSYADLLMAIVLWDDIYYPQNDHNWWNSFPSQVQDKLKPIDDSREEGLIQSIKRFYQRDNVFEEDVDWMKWKNFQGDESEIVGCGAFRYMMLSSNNECDYLPCTRRQSFLLQYSKPEKIQQALSRIRLQEDLDKTIEEYYAETYKSLFDFSNLKLKMPVLSSYIFDCTPDGMTSVDYAFHLKNEGPVIKYRQYLSQIEDAFENQKWKDLRYLLQNSKDAVSDVIFLDRKNLGSISVNLLPTPSVLLKCSGINLNLSSTPSLTLEKAALNPTKKMHLTFLRDLTSYAINDMKRW